MLKFSSFSFHKLEAPLFRKIFYNPISFENSPPFQKLLKVQHLIDTFRWILKQVQDDGLTAVMLLERAANFTAGCRSE